MKKSIVVFTRVPWHSDTKTRLRPLLTPDDCAEFQSCMLRDVLAQCRMTGFHVTVCYTPFERRYLLEPLLHGESVELQSEGTLREKMADAMKKELERFDACVMVGSNTPLLTHETLAEAFSLLEDYDMAFAPTTDGGYYLSGMKKFCPDVFRLASVDKSAILRRTMQTVSALGLTAGICTVSHNLGLKEDLLQLASEIDRGQLQCPATRQFLASRGFLRTF